VASRRSFSLFYVHRVGYRRLGADNLYYLPVHYVVLDIPTLAVFNRFFVQRPKLNENKLDLIKFAKIAMAPFFPKIYSNCPMRQVISEEVYRWLPLKRVTTISYARVGVLVQVWSIHN
jgi:hypothetical protein